MQAQGINTKVVGPDHKTVISLDMGLYKPAKQLQMARKDLDHVILRPGELHITMAQLRSIGAYMENSGLDFCWTEAEIYGPLVVKQILDGKHVKRGVEAHLLTLQALFQLYLDAFFKECPALLDKLSRTAEALRQSCKEESCDMLKEAHLKMIETIKVFNVMDELVQFNTKFLNRPAAVVMLNYMQMVILMMLFIRSVRTGDWNLHLMAIEAFAKHFFALDKLVYARMIPVYLADMETLKDIDTEAYQEFLQGNWVVNKNAYVPFCAIGADHALEQINRSMKVAGGLVGITLNDEARLKFFLIAPEMAKLAREAWEMAGGETYTPKHHHALLSSTQLRHDKNIEALTVTMRTFTDPFTEDSEELVNLVTKEIMPEKVKKDLCEEPAIGEQLLNDFVKARIVTRVINLWDPMKRRHLQVWNSVGKQVRVKVDEKMIELKEDRNLFARMLLVSKSRKEIDLAETIGKHELSVVPRALFTPDGTMLHCRVKSDLMAILEQLPEQVISTNHSVEKNEVKVILVDAMAEVQAFGKPDHVHTCGELADVFTSRMLERYRHVDELHLIFDQYLPQSLKKDARQKRNKGKPEIAYRIKDTTNIAKVPMKQLLSSTKTKKELTNYLAEKMLVKAQALERKSCCGMGR